MQWAWHRPEEPPEDVRLVNEDGMEIRCGVLRDEDRDEGAIRAWQAVPVEEVTDEFLSCGAFYLRFGKLPGRTTIHFDLVFGE